MAHKQKSIIRDINMEIFIDDEPISHKKKYTM